MHPADVQACQMADILDDLRLDFLCYLLYTVALSDVNLNAYKDSMVFLVLFDMDTFYHLQAIAPQQAVKQRAFEGFYAVDLFDASDDDRLQYFPFNITNENRV